jgi:hypothetical protein
MNKTAMIFAICSSLILLSTLHAAPQSPEAARVQTYSPYSYQYKVEDAQQKLYHDKTETSDESGKVSGLKGGGDGGVLKLTCD